MCLIHSVGRNGFNGRDDVCTVQILLNLNIGRLIPFRPVGEDGSIGPATIGLFEAFETRVVGVAPPTGRLDPGSPALARLRECVPHELSCDVMQAIMIHASRAVVARYFPALLRAMSQNFINTSLRQAHFLAQLAHESGEFRYTEELASGAAYEGRKNLGNTEPGDGVRFKGRGLIQITGRANYQAYGNARGRDFTSGDNPRLLASDPFCAVDSACWYWVTRNLNTYADADDVLNITRRINGGINGLDDRKLKLARAKFFLGA